jgi:hypothetical protein
MVNMVIGLGLVLYMVGVKGWLSLYLLMIMIPLVGRYVKILSRIMGGINLNESIKKLLTLLVILILRRVILERRYVIAFIVFTNGILGTVLMGVYVFVLLRVGLWAIVLTYAMLGNYIGDNYKILGLRVLPLIIFFVKVCGSFLLMWLVIVYAMYNVL